MGTAKIPEDFQNRVNQLITGCTQPMLDFIRSEVMEREKALRKSETKPEKAMVFDTEGMPD